MTRTDVLELIRNGENSGIEFKLDVLENHKLAREIVAFANLEGGVLLLGVDDSGNVAGTTRAKLEEWVMTACRDKIRPEIIPYFEVVKDVTPGRDIALVRVTRGWTVHHLWHENHRTYLIRVGSESREASQEELSRLFQRRGAFRTELRPISGATLADLDLRRLVDYFGRVRGQPMPASEDVEGWHTLLVNTELMVEEQGAAVPTFAGLALFGRQPHRFIPHSAIDAASYAGVEKDYAAIHRDSLRGPLVGLFRQTPDDRVELEQSGLIEQALAFVGRHAPATATLSEGRRIDRPAVPDDVLREVVVNALAHRDYLLSGSTVELSIFSDRIEVSSPGNLPNGITPARMRTGCRASRNQLVKDVLLDYGYMEHTGMGVPRKVVRGMKSFNQTEPDLVPGEETFLVRLRR